MIITISREAGCGGHEVGLRLAQKLGVEFYDKKKLAEYAENHGYESNIAEFSDDVKIVARGNRSELKSIICEIANKGSCVIVGRCADHILRDRDDVTTVFIHADRTSKVARVMERNEISFTDAQHRIKLIDNNRREYFEKYTKSPWGKANSYNLCLDSAYLGLNGCVDTIIDFVNNRLEVHKCFD